MPTKKVTRQQKQSMSLEAAAIDFAPQVGPSAAAFWVSIVEEGEPVPQTDEERILALGNWLEDSRERTVAADDAYDKALRERHRAVVQRDSVAGELRKTILAVRRNFDGIYGQGQAAELTGLIPDMPEDAVLLQRFARAAVNDMLQPEFELPLPPRKVASIAVQDVLDEITPDLEALEDILGQADMAKRVAQRALEQKELAAEFLGRALLHMVRYLEALFVLAGEDFLAERLRQSSRVSSSTEPDGEPDGDNDEEEVEPAEVDDGEPPAVLSEDLDVAFEAGVPLPD